jgi:ribosomal protein L32
LAKKGVAVWISSSLTFWAVIHFVESFSVLFFSNQIMLLRLYPLINEELQAVTPMAYFLGSATATLILWGVTCVIAFENPVETFLNKIISDAKTQGAVESQLLEEKSEILDAMNETLELNNAALAKVRDLVYNVRTEVQELQPLKENTEKLRTELSHMKKEIRKFEENLSLKCPNVCSVCGKPILPQFKVCPYCGENMKVLPKTVIALKDYK